jgi:hypothetical protein
MDKKEQNSYSKGHFPVHISVTGESTHGDALSLLEKFIQQAGEKYPLAIQQSPTGDATKAEATLSVPFPDRENIRIDFNIFASDMESIHGNGLYFHMESAFI